MVKRPRQKASKTRGALSESGCKSWLEVLKASRILMVWDGLELDGKTGKISDPDLAEFYLQMLKGMTAGPRHHHLQVQCLLMP